MNTAQPVRVVYETDPTPLVLTATRLLTRVIRERTGLETAVPAVFTGRDGRLQCPSATMDKVDGASILLAVEPGIGTEGFRIEDTDCGVRIVGNDERGLLYGVGRLLRDASLRDGAFTPGTWRGVSVPTKTVRGMYFATHFHNFYHDAPVEDVRRYVEDLALWGCNALSVWFDMHHYRGIDDPAAQAMIERLRDILEAAQAVGIRPGLTSLSNEAYDNSPEALRADWTAGHDGYARAPGGHYHREICPSKPGGLDHIIELRREMLEAFADLDIGYFWIWPYDQGGCTCEKCAPWGANGFLRTAEPVAKLVRQVLPSAKIVLSTWYFDRFTPGEWEGLAKAFAGGAPDWVDYLLADDYSGFAEYPIEHGFPGDLPAVSFPEISMCGMGPWGGFGANPRPRHWQEYWDTAGKLIDGFFPYSEGIFEDLNKVLLFQWGWDPKRKAEDIVREYAAGHFSPDVAEDVLQAVLCMEQDHGHSVALRVDGKEQGLGFVKEKAGLGVEYELAYKTGDLPEARKCLDLMNGAEVRLPESIRPNWRWRVLWLRAALDAALKASEGKPTEQTDAWFEELRRIYYAQEAEPSVRPPSRRAIDGLVRH